MAPVQGLYLVKGLSRFSCGGEEGEGCAADEQQCTANDTGLIGNLADACFADDDC